MENNTKIAVGAAVTAFMAIFFIRKAKGRADILKPSNVTWAAWNKNLGNIRNAGKRYAGEITLLYPLNAYKQFSSYTHGAAAMIAHLRRYINGDIFKSENLNTIERIINKYAPPSENDTEGYIKKVVQRMGISRTTKINPNDPNLMWNLSKAMSIQEDVNATNNYTVKVFNAAWKIALKQS
jgi:hypothetical protein